MKKFWKWLRLYLILCGFGINLFILWMLAGWPVFVDRWVTFSQEPHKADAIVCLAEGLTGNNLPSEQGWRGITAAHALYTDGWAEKVIFSGGGVNQTSEGEVYAEAAAWFGLPQEAILIDPFPNSTAEHPLTLKKIEGITPDSPLIVVTTSLHSKRSWLCFKKAGYTNVRMVTSYKAKSRDPEVVRALKASEFQDFKPSGKKYNDFLLRLRVRTSHFLRALREMAAISVYKLKGHL